jgi:hypothetical protein
MERQKKIMMSMIYRNKGLMGELKDLGSGGSLKGLGKPPLKNSDLGVLCLEPPPTSSLEPSLTITLFPKAGLLGWD